MQRTQSDHLAALVLPLAVGLVLARLLRPAPLFDSASAANAGFLALGLINALCVVPAALAAVLPGFRRSLPASLALFAVLGVLATASILWAANGFQAALAASNLLAAWCLGYAVFASVRSLAEVRWIQSLLAAAVLALALQSALYLAVDRPMLLEWWQQNRAQQLQSMGSDAYTTILLEGRIASRQLFGFFFSPNTLAALAAAAVVQLVAAASSVLWGARANARAWACGLALLGIAGLAFWLIVGSGARAAGAAAIAIGAVIGVFAAGVVSPRWKWRVILAGAVLAVLAAVLVPTLGAAMDQSLHFRQAYWKAALRITADRPLGGVGWGNFGWFYPEYRPPSMPEEIKDPHNFLLHCAAELGIPGLVIALAWVVLVLCRCSAALLRDGSTELVEKDYRPAIVAGAVALVAGLLTIGVGHDLGTMPRFVLLAVAGLLTLLVVEHYGLLARAPLAGLAGAVLVLLALATLDVVLLEPAALAVFMVLLGGVEAGLRPVDVEHPQRAGGAWGRWVGVGGGVLALLLAAGVWIGAPRRAGAALAEARDLAAGGASREAILAALAHAEHADHRSVEAKVMRAGVLGRSGDFAAAGQEYQAALQLNPGDVILRVAYADALRQSGQDQAAREQLAIALKLNNELPPQEPRRLPRQLEETLQREVEAGQAK